MSPRNAYVRCAFRSGLCAPGWDADEVRKAARCAVRR